MGKVCEVWEVSWLVQQGELGGRARAVGTGHMNRKTHFFQKHILNDKKLPPEQIREKLFKDIFGFTRMRSDLKARVLGIFDHVIAH